MILLSRSETSRWEAVTEFGEDRFLHLFQGRLKMVSSDGNVPDWNEISNTFSSTSTFAGEKRTFKSTGYSEGIPSHNLKVVSSNLAPATKKSRQSNSFEFERAPRDGQNRLTHA